MLLRKADGDGLAETRMVLLDGLTSPFGMSLARAALYIANADALSLPDRHDTDHSAGRAGRGLAGKFAQPALVW